MSEFLDELARTLAKPMPRSRVVRILGGSIVAAAFPLARPGLRAADAAPIRRGGCGDPGTCATKEFPKVCGCDFLAGCYRDCCAPDDTCCKWPRTGDGPPCEKNCCPKGTRCGSGEPGDVCVPVCPTHCGGKCCEEGEYCADAHRSLCCNHGETECHTFPPAGSAPTFKEPAICCPKDRPKCCANTKTKECCEAAGSCCAGKCCPPDKECANGVCACPKGTTLCGRNCCKKADTCCPGKTACCKKGETCCGEECCGDNKKCCPGPDKHCCKDMETCCGPGCCPPGKVCAERTGATICCAKGSVYPVGKRSFCCPPGTVPSKGGCCPPAIPDCCTGELPPLPVPGKVCVSGGMVAI